MGQSMGGSYTPPARSRFDREPVEQDDERPLYLEAAVESQYVAGVKTVVDLSGALGNNSITLIVPPEHIEGRTVRDVINYVLETYQHDALTDSIAALVNDRLAMANHRVIYNRDVAGLTQGTRESVSLDDLFTESRYLGNRSAAGTNINYMKISVVTHDEGGK